MDGLFELTNGKKAKRKWLKFKNTRNKNPKQLNLGHIPFKVMQTIGTKATPK